MAKYSTVQTVECFHLAFLEVLRVLRLDPARYVLKGGANLRYFFDSVRYSEDIDLDVSGVAGWMLENKIDGVLSSQPLKFILRSSGLAVVATDITKPKQTDTTRHWKVPITAPGQSEPVRTKIELSNRNGEHRYVLETVPDRVVRSYGLRAPSTQHYAAEPAAEQKIKALAGRSETQARDIFDLELLLRKVSIARGAVDPEICKRAAERGLELPYEAFSDQVLPFLDPEIAELYDATTWDHMQEFVTSQLLTHR